MSFRQLFRTLLKKNGPFMYATSFIFVDHSETKKPTEGDKLKFEPPDIKKLTHEYMIQQSTIDALNSTTQILTIAYTAIIRTSDEYKALLNELISLTRETSMFTVGDEHWDMIIELRSKVQNKEQMLTNLTGYVQYIHKMAVAVSEICYLSGMDNLSFTLSQQVDDIIKKVQEEVDNITKLEQEYCNVHEECIKNFQKENIF
ncbi:uncharacterized protein LOC143186897 [Calliopsis andreniformis]|uniref:uncharacterized protein LOC143186897 n=1 Tax=Calliopsis andreniformis TaxID=337506 RepID=UPI003FCD7383